MWLSPEDCQLAICIGTKKIFLSPTTPRTKAAQNVKEFLFKIPWGQPCDYIILQVIRGIARADSPLKGEVWQRGDVEHGWQIKGMERTRLRTTLSHDHYSKVYHQILSSLDPQFDAAVVEMSVMAS